MGLRDQWRASRSGVHPNGSAEEIQRNGGVRLAGLTIYFRDSSNDSTVDDIQEMLTSLGAEVVTDFTQDYHHGGLTETELFVSITPGFKVDPRQNVFVRGTNSERWERARPRSMSPKEAKSYGVNELAAAVVIAILAVLEADGRIIRTKRGR